MELYFPVNVKIQKPISEVFDAVYDPKKLSSYFTTGGASAPLDQGQTVTWDFADFPGAFPVIVKESKKNQRIVFEWEASDGSGSGGGYNTKVEMNFSAINESSTLVNIVETGWDNSEKSLKGAAGNGQGWMHMACCLKAYLEYGINLRKGFF